MSKAFAPPATLMAQVAQLPSDSAHPTAFEMYFKMPVYSWIDKHPVERKRFHRGLTEMENCLDRGLLADAVLSDLGPTITLVDVGGGRGGLVMQLLKRYPGWKAVIQDTAEVIAETRQFWQDNMPEGLNEGRVTFLAHSFLEPTPLPPVPDDCPYVFFLKNVLHNWPDDAVKMILNVRAITIA
ncbi:S-adenosyl-L-methionine-dependent methyltransferase [Calocera cornea HHB12733]|uniref:S-adenosyl-L-methionine-dependent methyltransferase n=1 Tax=Calocera cornea HHB12733 TaxID=1353952 RepID=A0A165GBF1_9BASI|nr:S-adenosyl-L-methionine-dependent methyltransferase [Calocera cornea HHB12733]